PAQCGEGLQEADRDQGRQARRVLCGGRLSPGLSDAAPEPALHCLQRHSEGGGPAEDLCRQLHCEANAGEQEGHQLRSCYLVVFSSREPVSTSLENTPYERRTNV